MYICHSGRGFLHELWCSDLADAAVDMLLGDGVVLGSSSTIAILLPVGGGRRQFWTRHMVYFDIYIYMNM